ncbi:MAG: metallophosphoesterase [Pirellulales bacterium]
MSDGRRDAAWGSIDLRASRRRFLQGAGVALAGVGVGGGGRDAVWAQQADGTATTPVEAAFFVVSDTHYFAQRESPGELETRSRDVCRRLVETLNRLPGTEIPAAAGGGVVATPQGVIHAGDVIDTGDKQGDLQRAMQATEWRGFVADYGLDGRDGLLKYPVYEIAGNHDAPRGVGLAIEQIRERNSRRQGLVGLSKNGVHYSWDWNGVHFVNLGLIVGDSPAAARKRRYAALDSYEFLVADLAKHVGQSGRPVVLTHHVDVARYTGVCDPNQPADSKEWDPCDVRAFYDAIRSYRVAGIFYGHTHGRAVLRWDGQSTKGDSGIAVFNTDNASHFNSDTQAFFYVELRDGRMSVREYHTKDRWENGAWTPQVWRA